jgi:hypothetical protein
VCVRCVCVFSFDPSGSHSVHRRSLPSVHFQLSLFLKTRKTRLTDCLASRTGPLRKMRYTVQIDSRHQQATAPINSAGCFGHHATYRASCTYS